MGKKITFIGAGSLKFTRGLVRDLMTFPAFQDATICLMDISEERLAYSKKSVEAIMAAGGYNNAIIVATTDRKEALLGADGVLCTIQLHDGRQRRADVEIPHKYGVDICIGDTRGPSGIFRYLRVIPVLMDICRDMERYCPEAVFLNYTNPMAMLCRTIQTETKLLTTGLCHSVQGTAKMLARWIGAPLNEVSYRCAGINHQAWYLDFLWNGKDAYPLIKEAVAKEETYNEEQVRNQMLLHLGYFVTESSGHNSEYNAWFRKREDLLEKYCTHGTGWNPGINALKRWGKRDETAKAYDWKAHADELFAKPFSLERGNEYAASIFNAIFGDGEPFEFNGNVLNHGLIENLLYECCVEVPVLATRRGLNPIQIGKLPPQLAILNNINAGCEELAVEAHLTGDPRKVFHAICHDPLTSAVLSLDEIQSMVDDMFEVSREWLPQFKHVN